MAIPSTAAVTAPTNPTAVPPVAAPAAPSSLPVKDPIIEKAQKATTPAEIRRLNAEFLAQPPPAPVAPTAEVPPAAPPVETTPVEPAPEVAPVAAEVPPGAEAPVAPADPDAPAVPAEDTPPAAPGPVEVPDANNLRIRPPADDKLGRLTAAFMQKDRGLTMAQAMAKAQAQLGIAPEAAATAPTAPVTPAKDGLPKSVAEVDSSIAALEAERLTKLTGLDFEAVAKIDSNLRTLERQRVDIQVNAREQQVQAAADYNRKFTESEAQAAQLYVFAANPDSAGAKRMQEIDAALKETNDPLYGAADKPLRIAQMVAAELNIAPRSKGAPTAPVKPAAPAVPAPKKQVLPGGSTAPAAPQPPPIDAKIAAVTTVHGLRQVYKDLGIPNV